MSHDVADLRTTIVPKSDQLNAEQLLGGPMTIRITDVRVGANDDQPVSIAYEDDNGRPFKPCKTMRKVLVFAWGEDGRKWVGRSMTLYNDTAVRFGGMDVGGIRISHLSDIDRDVQVSLTATKGKKALHTIKLMKVAEPMGEDELLALLRSASLQGENHLRTTYEALMSEANLAAVWNMEKKSLKQAAKDADASPI